MRDTLTLAGARPARFGRPNAVEFAGRSAAISRIQELVRRVATRDGGVLLVARRGTDAESVAREIHGRGRHANAPFVSVSCGAAGAERALFSDVFATGSSRERDRRRQRGRVVHRSRRHPARCMPRWTSC